MSDQQGKSVSGFVDVGELVSQKRLTRRDLLGGAVALGAFAALGPLASACGGSESGSSASPSAVASPKMGGHITAGIGGGSVKDILDAHVTLSEASSVMHYQLYDSLLGWDEQLKLVPRLAESYEANADASEWTVKLKPGLTFHDGKPVTADDVVYSFERIIDPKTQSFGASGLTNLKSGNIKKLDDLTVRFVLDPPSVIFYEQLAFYMNAIVRVGYERPKGAKGAIGTGPWKVTSYTPGQRIEFAANRDYWGTGPYADQLTLIEFADPTAKLNALVGGTIDYSTLLESAQVSHGEEHPGPQGRQRQDGRLEPVHHARRCEAVRRRARASGLPPHPRPPADDRSGLRRLRVARQRHVRAVRPGLSRRTCRSANRTSSRPSRCSSRPATTTTSR